MSKIKDWEKRPLLDVVYECCPTIELIERGYGEKTYYLGKCPLHDDNNPSFVIYPDTDYFICFSCYSKGGDVIDFVKEFYGIDFPEALKYATTKVDPAIVVLRELQKAKNVLKLDLTFYGERLHNMFTNLNYEEAIDVSKEIDKAIVQNRPAYIEQLLKSYKV